MTNFCDKHDPRNLKSAVCRRYSISQIDIPGSTMLYDYYIEKIYYVSEEYWG